MGATREPPCPYLTRLGLLAFPPGILPYGIGAEGNGGTLQTSDAQGRRV
jgi:hypothetical protein